MVEHDAGRAHVVPLACYEVAVVYVVVSVVEEVGGSGCIGGLVLPVCWAVGEDVG